MLILLHASLKQVLEESEDHSISDLSPKLSFVLSELEARGVIPPAEGAYRKKLKHELHEFAAERDMLESRKSAYA